jgi:hypothetical protein
MSTKAVENNGENEGTGSVVGDPSGGGGVRTKGLSVPDQTPRLAHQAHAKATREADDSLSFAFLGGRGKADGRFAIVALVVLVFAAFLVISVG